MSKSAHLRAQDVRAIYLLVGECRELGDDPIAWRQHWFREAALLSGADVAMGGETAGIRKGRLLSLGTTDWGWENGLNRAGWDAAVAVCAQDPSMNRTVALRTYIQRVAKEGGGTALARSDLLTERDWDRAWCRHNLHKVAGVDHAVWCFGSIPRGKDDNWSGILLCRAEGRPNFSPREKGIIRECHAALLPLIGGPLARFSDPSPSALPPRIRLVLRCLLEGDSDQQIAARMKLSRYTINEYVDRIYRHFGVQSRPILLARWIRRRWSEPLAALTDLSPFDLPPRPKEVLRCLLEGDSNKQVARRLGLSQYTVNEHVDRIFRHFNVQSRQQLLARWIQRSGSEA